MLAEHGSESDAQEALKMFEAFVKVRVTTASSAMGQLPWLLEAVLQATASSQQQRPEPNGRELVSTVGESEADHATRSSLHAAEYTASQHLC